MGLLLSLRSETLKTKRTASFYLAIAGAAFGPLMSLLDVLLDEGITANDQDLYLAKMFTTKFQMVGFLVFPIFIILITTLLAQTEYKNNAWKQVLTSPQTKLSIFVAKFINVHRLILVFLIATQFFTLVNAVIIHFTHPWLNLFSQPLDVAAVIRTLTDSYVSLLALCVIQFWLGLRFRNFIAPIGIGIGLWFIGSVMMLEVETPIARYFPYSFHVYSTFPDYKAGLNTVHLMSVIYAVVFLLIGFADFRSRRMSG